MIIQENTNEVISKSEDAIDVVNKYIKIQAEIDRMKEMGFVLGLDDACKLLFIDLAALGQTSEAAILHLSLISFAVKWKSCSQIIVIHTHPNGIALPSTPDLDVASAAVRLCRRLAFNLWDFSIISNGGFYSMRKEGLLENLKKGINDEIEAGGRVAHELDDLSDNIKSLNGRFDRIEIAYRDMAKLLSDKGLLA